MFENVSDLALAFDFSAADLEANHAGHMTDSQRETLKGDARSRLTACGILAAFGIFIIVVTFPKSPSDSYFLFAVMFILFVAGVYALFNMYRDLQADIQSGAVDTMSGRPYLYAGRGRSSRSYRLSINGQNFNLKEAQYRALDLYLQQTKGNPQLTVYFTLQARAVLSAVFTE